MLVEAHAQYSCGGYPSPTYNGVINVALNISKDATEEQVYNELSLRAQKQISGKTMFSYAMIRVIEITDIKHTFMACEVDQEN